MTGDQQNRRSEHERDGDRSHRLAHRVCRARARPPSPTRWPSGCAREGHRVEVLDGDEIREFLSAGLGFTREDRHTNVQRIGFVAELLARNGVKVLVPVIAPYADSREAVRKRHQAAGHRLPGGARRHPGRGVLRARREGPVRQAGGGRDLRADRRRRPVRGARGARSAHRVARARPCEESAAALHALLTERGLA